MFVSFLLPYIDRGQGPIFQWLMFKQLATLGSEQVAFIADQRYFAGVKAAWGEELDQFGFRYRCPAAEEFETAAKYVLPDAVFAELDRQKNDLANKIAELKGAETKVKYLNDQWTRAQRQLDASTGDQSALRVEVDAHQLGRRFLRDNELDAGSAVLDEVLQIVISDHIEPVAVVQGLRLGGLNCD